jgi:hypothetical protein
MTIETWVCVTDRLPDCDMTVMIYDPTADEPIWLAYFHGSTWRVVDGMPAQPTHWMEMPDIPNCSLRS